MKNYPVYLITFFLTVIVCTNIHAEGVKHLADTYTNDTIKDKETKKLERKADREKLRHSHKRFGIRLGYVYAFLDTEVSFELPIGNLNSTLSFEQNLGLPSKSFFLTGSFLYRITPRSGIYTHYYGIYRGVEHQTEREYIFKNDTIPNGTSLKAHFNTQVISTGYLFSVLRDPNAYLGFYFNIYFMFLDTGAKSDLGTINSNVKLAAPLPNLGLLVSFRLTKWLNLNGGLGFFSLNTKDFGGALHNFDISFMSKPLPWLGISLTYQEFDVRLKFLSGNINTVVDYNFRGPSLGVSFIF